MRGPGGSPAPRPAAAPPGGSPEGDAEAGGLCRAPASAASVPPPGLRGARSARSRAVPSFSARGPGGPDGVDAREATARDSDPRRRRRARGAWSLQGGAMKGTANGRPARRGSGGSARRGPIDAAAVDSSSPLRDGRRVFVPTRTAIRPVHGTGEAMRTGAGSATREEPVARLVAASTRAPRFVSCWSPSDNSVVERFRTNRATLVGMAELSEVYVPCD